MSRKSAREVAFKLIFENCFHTPEQGITYEEFLAGFNIPEEMPEDSVFFELKNKLDDNDIDYIKNTYVGVIEHSNDIKDIISGNLVNYTAERLFKVDFAILIYSVYELKFTNEPKKVVINEAVELAKKYSNENSPSFINGVLAKIINE